MSNFGEFYGENVFNDCIMKERLPKATYKALKKAIEKGATVDLAVADVVALALKDWAVEKGATHFTHWFQPLTGITAEKHDSFINPTEDGKVLLEFSGKELIKGEPDASSFPSGGSRATCAARGYTAWDMTSPAFVKDETLYIPTAFVSYTGEALDKKIPLLRSMEVLSKEAIRVLKALGNTTANKVTTTVGPEQEYFIVDKKLYDKRPDLIYTGRTLFGAKPPKGQELEDHYFGSLKERISDYMKDLDKELWKLGISVKTKHNEVAPAQHELAPIFTTTNVATDTNQLTMDVMKKVALRHGLVCLLHEKPFAGVNGSGKHNNWSMSTDDGQNLLDPTDAPHKSKQFQLFLTSVIKAVDEYSDLLRASAANPGNDHRLGANEAPPAIISVFLGDQLQDLIEQIEKGEVTSSISAGKLDLGVSTLPKLIKDPTDRNRTSPFAFTGNKFEFRMVPSSGTIADCNTVLNTIVAEVLSEVADRLEKAADLDAEINAILTETVKEHSKIIFNGNGYSDEWVVEAEKRGLANIKTTVEATKAYITEKNVALMEKHGVLSKLEMHARYDVNLEIYAKTTNIEAETTLEIAKRQILPAVIKFETSLAKSISAVKAAGVSAGVQCELLAEVDELAVALKKNIGELEASVEKAQALDGDAYAVAHFYKFDVFEKMQAVRAVADTLETLVDKDVWPLPTYGELLFNV
ncbi:glutamine synthetase III [Clostridium folliculivorans]|uniref:Glutamine synthetase n=1 Tax=Clostridium folliculivorans TaxID=2886038 RepID=A0A9W6DBI8_9CLOT|nr:glutamine synthetase III [Clostridium folliculivorans]GKU26026.1 glutamine synthetase [Clostridium folliculivorans]GKU28112.1 glutamine synthetase [Clostridium folliculivorans]